MSEALIFAATNPKYDDRLFIELQVQYVKIPSSNLGRTCWVQKLFLTFRTIFVHNMLSPCSAERRASDKDLPVLPISVHEGCVGGKLLPPPVPTALENSGKAKHYLRSWDLKKNPGMIYEKCAS